MKKFTGLNIKKIYTIVSKDETEDFHYENNARAYDGFVLITDGSGIVVDRDLKSHDLNPGDLIFLRKNEFYQLHFTGHCSYITSGYDLEFDSDGEFPVPLPLIRKCDQSVMPLIKELCRIWQTRSWDSYTRCRIILLELYIKEIKTLMTDMSEDDIIKKATEFIHRNFRRNFSGAEIANHCNISLSYLRSKFSSETGMTINGYRDSLRLDVAKEMLASRLFSVTEISSQLGFCDVYHFSKTFKALCKISPSDYVKKLNI